MVWARYCQCIKKRLEDRTQSIPHRREKSCKSSGSSLPKGDFLVVSRMGDLLTFVSPTPLQKKKQRKKLQWCCSVGKKDPKGRVDDVSVISLSFEKNVESPVTSCGSTTCLSFDAKCWTQRKKDVVRNYERVGKKTKDLRKWRKKTIAFHLTH